MVLPSKKACLVIDDVRDHEEKRASAHPFFILEKKKEFTLYGRGSFSFTLQAIITSSFFFFFCLCVFWAEARNCDQQKEDIITHRPSVKTSSAAAPDGHTPAVAARSWVGIDSFS